MRASTNAHTARARVAQNSASISSPSNPMAGAYSRGAVIPGARRALPHRRGISGQHRAPERCTQLRGPDPVIRRQAFLAGTAVGLAGLAVRARLARGLLTDALVVAGVRLRAAGVFLRGARVAGAGSSTTASAVSLTLSATSAVLLSALSATLAALAAVFCAIEVTSLEAS